MWLRKSLPMMVMGHGLYKTVSGSYVIDDSGLSVGSATTDPTILTTETVSAWKDDDE